MCGNIFQSFLSSQVYYVTTTPPCPPDTCEEAGGHQRNGCFKLFSLALNAEQSKEQCVHNIQCSTLLSVSIQEMKSSEPKRIRCLVHCCCCMLVTWWASVCISAKVSNIFTYSQTLLQTIAYSGIQYTQLKCSVCCMLAQFLKKSRTVIRGSEWVSYLAFSLEFCLEPGVHKISLAVDQAVMQHYLM